MAAIYRFGFEGSTVPAGVSCTGYTTTFPVRFGTTGCNGSVTCQLSNELAVKASFELFIIATLAHPDPVFPMEIVNVGNAVYRVRDATTIDIKVGTTVVAELTVPTIVSGQCYEVRCCYVSGSAGMCIFEWDGNELTFDAEPGLSLNGNITTMTLGSVITNAHAIDNVAVNNASGGIDDDIPPITASFLVQPDRTGTAFDWTVPAGYTAVTALNGASIYSRTTGNVANYYFGVPSDSTITKASFEGLRIMYRGIRRTGVVLNKGVSLGYNLAGTNISKEHITRLGYSSQSRDYTALYDDAGAKISVAQGDAIQAYLEIIDA